MAFDSDFSQNRFGYLLYTATRAGRDPVNRIVLFFKANNTLIDAVRSSMTFQRTDCTTVVGSGLVPMGISTRRWGIR